ncbi:DUF5626 family protein [Lactiplantibacillus plantarum]|uniref:DUF5626 family protein n=1 Tax=Lactiplantibacillus plantarum TaxID=1590 RepID=UPI00351A1A15
MLFGGQKQYRQLFITLSVILICVCSFTCKARATTHTYSVSEANYSWSASYKVKVVKNKIVKISNVKLHSFTGKIIGYSTAHNAKKATLTIVKSYKIVRTRIRLIATFSHGSLHVKAS